MSSICLVSYGWLKEDIDRPIPTSFVVESKLGFVFNTLTAEGGCLSEGSRRCIAPYIELSQVAPSVASSRICQSRRISWASDSILIIAWAIVSRLCVASARMFGPAPLRHTSSRTGYISYLSCRTLSSPGIKVVR